jgi:quercetin dioxygenase-like cupin family protein
MNLDRWDPARDGPLSEKSLRSKLESRGYSVVRFVYPPRTVFPDHEHAIDTIDAVVSGRFRMTVEGESVILKAGDAIEVPRETTHSAEVVGDMAVVSLDATRKCTR